MDNLQENITKVPFRDIAQSPLAYALYVVVVVLLGVIAGQRFDNVTDKGDCDKRVERLEKQVQSERSEKDEVFKAYIVERSANKQIQKAVDSTAIINFKKHEK